MAFAVAQFRGHDRFLTTILDKLGDGWRASWLVGLYYVSIPVVGSVCHVLTIYMTQFIVDLF